jgi:hypothetical protein
MTTTTTRGTGAGRAPTNCEPVIVEYLYGTLSYFSDENEHVRRVIPYRITKRTPKRVFYTRDEHPFTLRSGSVDRQSLETHGVATNHARSYHSCDHRLYATSDAAWASITPQPAVAPTLRQLRRAAAEAHPDRGGSDTAFDAAWGAYQSAKARAARHADDTPGQP